MTFINLILRFLGLIFIVSAAFTWITYKYPKINLYGIDYKFLSNLNFVNIHNDYFYWILVCLQGFLGIYLLMTKFKKKEEEI